MHTICRHIMTNGPRCGSPALGGGSFASPDSPSYPPTPGCKSEVGLFALLFPAGVPSGRSLPNGVAWSLPGWLFPCFRKTRCTAVNQLNPRRFSDFGVKSGRDTGPVPQYRNAIQQKLNHL